MTFIP